MFCLFVCLYVVFVCFKIQSGLLNVCQFTSKIQNPVNILLFPMTFKKMFIWPVRF